MKINYKLVLFFMSLILIIGIFTSITLSNNQDHKFIELQMRYNEGLEYFNNKEYENAYNSLNQIVDEFPDSEPVNYLYAISAVNTFHFKESLIYMERALDINPYNVENPVFMIQYAEILINADKIEEAKLVIEHSKNLEQPTNFPNFQERLKELEEIVKKGTLI
ncbi:hypothetical protein ACFOZY_06065 [Chungangia koreensis]|uniref:Tetratricopeptide repeat-containing protein n=1 Tax=Chungangia koreensis TaxID=752657 RepID=A0ABV8X240_9LACT